MRLTAAREPLLAALSFVCRALPSREVKPILNGVLARAEDGRLTLSATDLEVGARAELAGVTIEEPGAAILPGAQTAAILRESSDEQLTVEGDAAAVLLSTLAAEFNLPADDPAQFPEWPGFDGGARHEFRAGDLAEMLRRTVYAVAPPGGRYSMTGVLWELKGDTARLVGSDGYRLAVEERPAVPFDGHESSQAVVPTKAMKMLAALVGAADGAEVVAASIRKNDALFRVGSSSLYSRLVEGRYPDWKAILPRAKATPATFTAGVLAAAVRQANLTVDAAARVMRFSFSKNKLTLSASGIGRGASKVETPVGWEGKSLEIAFTPAWVSDFLGVLPSDAEVRMDLIDKKTPVLCHVGQTHRCLIVPTDLPAA